MYPSWTDSLRGSSVRIGTIQRILAWPLRKDDTHKSRSVNDFAPACKEPSWTSLRRHTRVKPAESKTRTSHGRRFASLQDRTTCRLPSKLPRAAVLDEGWHEYIKSIISPS